MVVVQEWSMCLVCTKQNFGFNSLHKQNKMTPKVHTGEGASEECTREMIVLHNSGRDDLEEKLSCHLGGKSQLEMIV